ncbi:HNH endonuclease [Robinsoniella peoriensis]|uniref:HNH endonuclease n=1 Tax=Robinsoniella peoriensis TaxID=180332 RepID=UPI003751AEA7
MGYKRNVKENTRRLLYANSGNVCAMYGCSNPLIYANTSNISEVCHIEAVNDDGARYSDQLTDEYVNSDENLVLLCPTCHTIVDNKLNEIRYTVSYLKEMKKYHEQQVQEVLMSKAAIEPPILIEVYDVEKMVNYYNSIYEEQVEVSYFYWVLKNFLALNVAIRSIVYGIAIQCSEVKTEHINIQKLHESINLDIYKYAEILMLLENEGMIREVNYTGPLDGYEDQNGDWHLVQNDYLFKTTKGTWYIKDKGRIFVAIYESLKNASYFYDLVVNRNLEVLSKI